MTPEQAAEIQAALVAKGISVGTSGPNRNGIDGDYGGTTHRALLAAIAALPIRKPSQTGLANPTAFWNTLRADGGRLGPTLLPSEVDGVQNKLNAMGAAGWEIADAAYGLATSYHETAGTMQPIREFGRGKGKRYGLPGPHGGQIAYGRGDVQLTWPENYAKADRELGLGGALLANYDLAMRPDISAQIMVRGMSDAWFTRHRLSDHLPRTGPASRAQFVRARPIINSTDKADLIAGHALHFQSALQAGGWGPLTA